MKRIVAGALATIATLGLLSACGSDSPSASNVSTVGASSNTPFNSTDSTGVVFPEEVTIPPGLTLPNGSIDLSNISVPEQVIDQMIAQFEAAGMKVDKACFTALLQDESLRKLVESGTAPNQDVIKKFITCLGT
ncbi:MAG TPA: hypothetical protein VHQ23_10260 [Ilumatobacteraceae bacterium]|jgi:hypothetical protein|nr:hypothetical protein [Ilumatobacteraceae bacterium]